MKISTLSLIGAVIASGGLCGCAEGFGYDSYGYGPPPAYADVDFGGWYDDYYGPYVGGYWGPGDRFYYWDRARGRYRRDDGGHFRRQGGGGGFHPIQGHAPPARGGGPTRHR